MIVHPATRAALSILAIACTVGCGGSTPQPVTARDTDLETVPTVVLVRPEVANDARAVETETIRLRVVDGSRAETEQRPAIDDARRLYRDLQFEESLALIGELQQRLEPSVRTTEDVVALHQALVMRGMNELALGREAAARDALRAAATIRPDATLDEGNHPPNVRALYEAVRAEVRAAPPAARTVTTEPAGARVLLDGRLVGASPATLTAAPGRHYVHVEAAGHEPRTLAVALGESGEPLRVDLPEAPDEAVIAEIAGFGEADLRAIGAPARERLRETLEATGLVVLRRVGPRWNGASLDLETGRVQARESEHGDPGAARELVAALAPSRTRHVDRSSGAADQGEDDDGTVLASPWVWVAGGALVGLVILLAATADPGTDVVIDANP